MKAFRRSGSRLGIPRRFKNRKMRRLLMVILVMLIAVLVFVLYVSLSRVKSPFTPTFKPDHPFGANPEKRQTGDGMPTKAVGDLCGAARQTLQGLDEAQWTQDSSVFTSPLIKQPLPWSPCLLSRELPAASPGAQPKVFTDTASLETHVVLQPNATGRAPLHVVWPVITVRNLVGPEVRDVLRHKLWEQHFKINEPYLLPRGMTASEANALHRASIFVSIAAFRDDECATTVESMLEQAGTRHRLYFGISEERHDADVSCLTPLGAMLHPATPDRAARLRQALYGPDAPDALEVFEKTLTWSEALGEGTRVVATRSAIRDADMVGLRRRQGAQTPPPAVYLNPGYEKERIFCIGGRAEEARDLHLLDLLHSNPDQAEVLGFPRRGKGGPQQQLRRAFAGCRVLSRLSEPSLAKGPTYGRYITSLLYFNQDYYMVVDSHSRFSLHWDYKMIARVMQMHSPGVLSHYPNGYTPEAPEAEYKGQHVMCMCMGQMLANGMPKLGARSPRMVPGVARQPYAAAGYMFGDAQFVLDTPFDPFLPYLFDGEETLYSARMFTAGWDMYCPLEANILHHYGRPKAPRFFSLIRGREASADNKHSIERALYLLQSALPWYEYVEREARRLKQQEHASARGNTATGPVEPYYMEKAASTLSFVPREQRLVVPAATAAAEPAITFEEHYYGMGSRRSLAEYWEWIGLDDKGVTRRDNENRLESSLKACKEIDNFVALQQARYPIGHR